MAQLQAKGGQKVGYKFDTETLGSLQHIPEFLEEVISVRPSHATIIRRAIRVYGQYLDDLQKDGKLELEKLELFSAAGRTPNLN